MRRPGASRIANGERAVRIQDLTKRYGKRVAVDHLTIELPLGVTAGFIGPNGAGKTTTLAMLLGLIRPVSGSGTVLGQPLTDPAAYLPRVGALIENPSFYRGLSGRRNLEVIAKAAGLDPSGIPGILDRVNLTSRAGDAFRSYSLGMKQRLGIAAALLGDPDLLLLDEPTNGLDPAGSREMRDLLGSLAQSGRTALISSHILAELEQVCDWLIIIDHGKLLFQGPTASFLDDTVARLEAAPEDPDDLPRLREVLGDAGYRVRIEHGVCCITAPSHEVAHLGADVNRAASAHGMVLAQIHAARPSLEERYLAMLTGANDD